MHDVALSPDGRTLAVLSNTALEIVDVATRGHRSLSFDDISDGARFTPDGRFVVTGNRRGWVRLWSVDSGRPVGRRLGGDVGDVTSASVSPDGRTVVTGSTDGTIRLWDVDTGRAVGAPLPGVANRTVVAEFTPDGAYLLAITDAGHGFRWDMRPTRWAQHACVVAGRPLTRSEWEQALPGHEYAPACTG